MRWLKPRYVVITLLVAALLLVLAFIAVHLNLSTLPQLGQGEAIENQKVVNLTIPTNVRCDLNSGVTYQEVRVPAEKSYPALIIDVSKCQLSGRFVNVNIQEGNTVQAIVVDLGPQFNQNVLGKVTIPFLKKYDVTITFNLKTGMIDKSKPPVRSPAPKTSLNKTSKDQVRREFAAPITLILKSKFSPSMLPHNQRYYISTCETKVKKDIKSWWISEYRRCQYTLY